MAKGDSSLVTTSGDEQAEDGDYVTASFAEQRFSPVQYNSFGIGPFFYKTQVKPGETAGEALERAQAWVDRHAREQFKQTLEGFLARLHEAGDAVDRGRRR